MVFLLELGPKKKTVPGSSASRTSRTKLRFFWSVRSPPSPTPPSSSPTSPPPPFEKPRPPFYHHTGPGPAPEDVGAGGVPLGLGQVRGQLLIILVDVAVHHLDHDLDHRLPGSPSPPWWTTASVGISALLSRWTNFLKNQTKQLFLLQIKVMVGALLVFMAAVAIYFLCTSEVEA